MKKQYSFQRTHHHLFTLIYLTIISTVSTSSSPIPPTELYLGFETTLNQNTITTTIGTAEFHPILTDSTGNFTLTFLKLHDTNSISLAIIHLPSTIPVWQGELNPIPSWPSPTRIIFNGSLIITNPDTHTTLWSSSSSSSSSSTTKLTGGERVILTNKSNLQIHNSSNHIVWQSFDYPTDTLIDTQNLTSPNTLKSTNSLYTVHLISNYIALYAQFTPNHTQIYYKHTAMQVKSNILNGNGPVTLRMNTVSGYLGMYQTGSNPADTQPFTTYSQTITGIRRLRLESDGNLKSYYWSGTTWILDYQAITDTCDLPSPCGQYGLCIQDKGCSCLDNTTVTGSSGDVGVCYSDRISSSGGDFCNEREKFTVIRRTGVEVAFKEMMGYIKTTSYTICENECEFNCSCWGVVYNNATGFCYRIDYPIQTLVAVGDVTKIGYFKVKVVVSEGKRTRRWMAVVICVVVVVVAVVVGVGLCKVWKRRKYLESEEMLEPGPYKDLGSDSFGSIELSSSNR